MVQTRDCRGRGKFGPLDLNLNKLGHGSLGNSTYILFQASESSGCRGSEGEDFFHYFYMYFYAFNQRLHNAGPFRNLNISFEPTWSRAIGKMLHNKFQASEPSSSKEEDVIYFPMHFFASNKALL